uniref:GOLD domain-containing protein n=1 Tax=Ananas comosus var. bracteatus TaxID=296719 RepID=A0A6V7PQM1_ANACO|nr:unnamed protein product [Ananas comosus var. bracteatus]
MREQNGLHRRPPPPLPLETSGRRRRRTSGRFVGARGGGALGAREVPDRGAPPRRPLRRPLPRRRELPANLTVSARVSDPSGETLHHAESVERGEFSFEAESGGKHTACFWSPRFEMSASVAVDVDWTAGIRARDWPSLAKKGDLDAMEAELKKLEDSVKLIHDELMFLRQREAESQRLNEGTAERMLSFGMLSIAICLALQVCNCGI